MPADPLTAIGAITSIISLLKDIYKAIERLHDFQKLSGEVLASLTTMHLELATLEKALEAVELKDDEASKDLDQAFLNSLKGSLYRIQALSSRLHEVLPVAADSKKEKLLKGAKSLFKDKDIKK